MEYDSHAMAKGERGWNLRRGQPRPWALRGEQHPDWKGDAARPETKRARAQRLYQLGSCERCGAPATDRHHKDGDTGNNSPENIARLCRRCHMAEDGRLEAFRASSRGANPVVDPPKECSVCGRLAKPLRRGRCKPCYAYFRRNGEERPYIEDGRREKYEDAREVPCLRCGRPAGVVGPPVRGYCKSCYRALQRNRAEARAG